MLILMGSNDGCCSGGKRTIERFERDTEGGGMVATSSRAHGLAGDPAAHITLPLEGWRFTPRDRFPRRPAEPSGSSHGSF